MYYIRRSIIIVGMLSVYLSNLNAGWDATAGMKWLLNEFQSNKAFIKERFRPLIPIDQATKFVKRRYQVEKPDPRIEFFAHRALEKAGVTKPVIILQHNGPFTSATFSSTASQIYLIIGTPEERYGAQIGGDIYHEIGHIVNGDVSMRREWSEVEFLGGYLIANILTAVGGRKAFLKYVSKKPGLGILAGLASGYAPLYLRLGELVQRYRNRRREEKADAFGYNFAIKSDQVDVVFATIHSWFEDHASGVNTSLLNSPFSSHPKDIDRAKMGLRILQNNGIDVRDESQFPEYFKSSKKAKKFYLNQLDKLPEFKK